MGKLYQITSGGLAGYRKHYVRNVKTDKEAKKLGRSVFGKAKLHDVSYYAEDYNKSPYIPKSWQLTKSKFEKLKRTDYGYFN